MVPIEEKEKNTSKISKKGRKKMKVAKRNKKKVEVVEDVAKDKDQPIEEETPQEEDPRGPELFLSELQMKDIALFEARRRMQEQVMINLQQEMTLLNVDYKNKQTQIKNKIKSTQESQKLIKKEHLEFVAGVEESLGIKLSDYTYNELGRLTYNPIEPSGDKTEETPPLDNDG